MSHIINALDSAAEELEQRGLTHLAEELDKVSNALDRYSAIQHLDSNIKAGTPIRDCEFRIGSSGWNHYFKEARYRYEMGSITGLDSDDKIVLSFLETGDPAVAYDPINEKIAARGIYQGKSVSLDSPSRTPKGDKKKFQVYVNSGRKNKDGRVVAKKIRWGDPNLKIRNSDPEASKSFRARHQCSSKKDKKTPGWWACNVHLFAKQLGLSSNRPW
jgi:hypothetical protein